MNSVNTDQQKGFYLSSNTSVPTSQVVISSTLEKIQSHRDRYSLQLENQHIIVNKPLIYANHSCDPNCEIKPNDAGAFDLISKRVIHSGEELCFDYLTNEDELFSSFLCLCGSKNCRGYIFKRKITVKTSRLSINATVSVKALAKTLVIEWGTEQLPTEYSIALLVNEHLKSSTSHDQILINCAPATDISIKKIAVTAESLNLVFSHETEACLTFDRLYSIQH